MIKKEEQNIHMLRKYIDYPFLVTLCRLVIVVFEIMVFMTIISYKGWLIITAPLFLSVAYQIDAYLREVRKNLVLRYSLRNDLITFIRNNKIYEEELRQVVEEHSVKTRKFIVNSAIFNYRIVDNDTRLIIDAVKRGDALSKRMESLEVELESKVGLKLQQKLIRPTLVEYHFYLQKPERIVVETGSGQKFGYYDPIDLGYGVKYNPIQCPHILISGGTGSGKSIFISFLILELLKRQSSLFVCDPKNSDLGSLSHFMGDRVATDPNNIARVLRTAVEEMNARYVYMRENFRYGANFSDHNYNQIWIIFDEMGAFQATGTDKKSKDVVNEVMAYLKQIILLGRQAGVFVLIAAQQMRAETLNTDLRDNLGLRIALGANSSEGYRMTFGSATPTPEAFQPIEVKGAGYLYMQGSGSEYAEYFEAPFMDTKKIDFIEELTRLL